VFNTTFNNISVISWRPVVLVEETGVPGENHLLATSHLHSLSHNVLNGLELIGNVNVRHIHVCLFVCLMVFNATFNNISVIS
jgi:hypothetical protein